MAVEMAKRKYREAYDSGDAERVVEAQQEMQEATLRLHQAKNFQAPSLQLPQNEVQIPQQQPQQYEKPQAPVPDDKAVAWQTKNKWFGTNRSMTALALDRKSTRLNSSH